LGLNARFICCNIYDLPQHLEDQFDIVFTSYGVMGWLPDLNKWAALVNRYLKPGGRLVLVEFHPVVWMFNSDFTQIQYSYFNKETIVETETGTYADREAPIVHSSVSWNHSLGEVLGSLLRNGLTIKQFDEYDYAAYNCFAYMEQVGEDQYRIQHLQDKLPMMYSIVACK
jgi:SAM-dependent methyltransferase